MSDKEDNRKNRRKDSKIFMSKDSSSILIVVSILSILIMSIFFMSVLSTIAYAQIIIDVENIDIPSTVPENSEISISFSASNESSEIAYIIYQDGVPVSYLDSFDMPTNYSSAGRYEFTFFASDNESNASEMRVLEISDVPMTLALVNPVDKVYNARVMGIEVEVSTYADTCTYILTGPDSWNSSGEFSDHVDMDEGGQVFTQMVTLPSDGAYSFNATCSNIYDVSSVSSSFTVDTMNPVILSKSYSLDASNTMTISASTNKICSCRYDTSDVQYDSMGEAFTRSDSLQHSTTISGLPDGYYTYYIRCRNYNNVDSNVEAVAFNIVTKPKASITLSRSSPLRAGTYEVDLTTSEPVVNAPSLYYNFDTDTTARYVTLTGSGKDWSGYMIIEENVPNKVGTFHYSAMDFNNNVGNIISDGELFLVDTLKPDAPESIDAEERSDGSIKLRWYYDGEEVSRYNIYRTSGDDPEYVDYLDSTTAKIYVDDDVIEGITYYYRIAVVDRAGNDGLLSDVVQATSTDVSSSDASDYVISNPVSQNTGEQPAGQTLDIKLVPKVDAITSELDRYILDIDPVKSEISAINDPNKLRIITALGLIDDMNDAKSTITTLKGQAEGLKRQNLKQSELEVQLNKIRMDAIKAKSSVAEDIIVVEQSSYDQVTQESDVEAAIAEVLMVNLSRKVLEDYSSSNKQLQDNIIVKTEIIIFKIKYLGKDDYDKYTLVKKVVSSGQELKNVSIIETIPKSFESSASDISFDFDGQQLPTVVKDDPVLRWDVDSLNSKTVYYMTHNNAELLSAKGTRTIVLYRPDFKVTDTIQEQDEVKDGSGLGNMLTGFVSLDSSDVGSVSPIQWMVLIGVGMILGLSAYYVALDKKSKKYAAKRLKDHKIITKSLVRPLEVIDNDVKTSNITDVRNAHNSGPSGSTSIALSNRKGVRTDNATHTNYTNNQSLSVSQAQAIPLKNIPYMSADIVLNLDKVNELINIFDYENARIMFNECLKQYRSVKFNSVSEKNTVMLTMDHLFTKLKVYKAIYDSRKHILARDVASLKKDKDFIVKAHAKLRASLSAIDDDYLDAENKFLDYIASSRKHLDKIKF